MPVVLYVRGHLKINDYPHSVGIVGARRCSCDGKQTAGNESWSRNGNVRFKRRQLGNRDGY